MIFERNAEALDVTHARGITDVWSVPRHMVTPIFERLTSCQRHGASHVFVIDQSQGDRVNIGMSVNGTSCITDILGDDVDVVELAVV